jgi:hypothetical protein
MRQTGTESSPVEFSRKRGTGTFCLKGPEGASHKTYLSPFSGQDLSPERARNNRLPHNCLWRPFRAWWSPITPHPGRCPGLSYFSLSGCTLTKRLPAKPDDSNSKTRSKKGAAAILPHPRVRVPCETAGGYLTQTANASRKRGLAPCAETSEVPKKARRHGACPLFLRTNGQPFGPSQTTTRQKASEPCSATGQGVQGSAFVDQRCSRSPEP